MTRESCPARWSSADSWWTARVSPVKSLISATRAIRSSLRGQGDPCHGAVLETYLRKAGGRKYKKAALGLVALGGWRTTRPPRSRGPPLRLATLLPSAREVVYPQIGRAHAAT